MFAHAIKQAELAMFPILRFVPVSPNGLNMAVLGTGFFINKKGVFVTVSHVFDNAPPNSEFKFGGRIPSEVRNPPIAIEEIARDDHHDVYIGRIRLKETLFLRLSRSLVPVGRSVCISGYPMAQVRWTPKTGQGGWLKLKPSQSHVEETSFA